jgi:hypothetical protein
VAGLFLAGGLLQPFAGGSFCLSGKSDNGIGNEKAGKPLWCWAYILLPIQTNRTLVLLIVFFHSK